jgi:sporulation protein YlmC with PRC-barrel domain
MVHSSKEIIGYRVEAVNTEIGILHDVQFNDCTWSVEQFVTRPMANRPEKQLIISTSDADPPDWGQQTIAIRRSLRSLIHGSGVNEAAGAGEGHRKETLVNLPSQGRHGTFAGQGTDERHGRRQLGQAPLGRYEQGQPTRSVQSFRHILGRPVHADGVRVGTVEDLMIDPNRWTVAALAVLADDGHPSGRVLVPIDWVERFDVSSNQFKLAVPVRILDAAPRSPLGEPPPGELNRLREYFQNVTGSGGDADSQES